MMDAAGIDAAVLTSGAGMCADLERSRFINNKCAQAERDYPGRFIGAAHVHPLGGPEALKELARCSEELGFPGVVITSETNGLYLDAPEFDPFWAEVSRLGMYVFVHPALKLNVSEQFNADDMARSVGREFSLIMAIIRLINCGVLDRYPNLTVLMSHLGGGIAGVLGRIRKYQDKVFWGTAGNPKHGRVPEKDFDYYLQNSFTFDTGGFSGAMSTVHAALLELPESRMVFATDYPQEIRSRDEVRQFVEQIRALGSTGERILSGNVGLLIKQQAQRTAG
jgi:predicted TIM-barrel fold metal-dependent hydrolase